MKKKSEFGLFPQDVIDSYFEELEAAEMADEYAFKYAGGYEASKGDYEGACLARAEFDSGLFS